MSIYEKNLAVLSAKKPELTRMVIHKDDGCSYRIAPSGNGTVPNLEYVEGKSSVVFYDFSDPVKSASAYLDALDLKDPRFVVILGLGLGYHVIEMLNRFKDIRMMLIVEKDPACLKKAMEASNISSLIENSRVRWVVGCPEDQLYTTLYNTVDPGFLALKEMKLVPTPPSIAISPSYYSKVVRAFNEIANTWLGRRGNDPYDTLVGYEQFFLNIREYLENPGAGYFRGFFKGRPGVVVATGPSLRKNVHLLKDVEESAVIFSCDASLRILHEYGIYPHFVNTVERTPGMDKFFQGLENLDKTVFATASFVHRSTLDAYNGPYLFFHRFYEFMNRLGLIDDCVDLGQSSGNMAYEIARHMGCNPIILIGSDLAFDSSGNTHSDGFAFGQKHVSIKGFEKFKVPGNWESKVTTCRLWQDCIAEYERRIKDWDGTLINATEGGARIQGTKIMTLKQALDAHCNSVIRPRKMIFDHLSKWKPTRTAESLLVPLKGFIDSVGQGIATYQKLLGLLRSLLEKTENSGNELPPKLVREITDAVPNISTVLDNLTKVPMVTNFGEYFYTEIIPLLMEWRVLVERFENRTWADAYRIKLAESFFSAMGQLCLSLKAVLMDAEEMLSEMI